MMENVCGSDQFKKWWKCTFYNATINTTDILIEQVRKFQNSYFEEHLWKAGTNLQKVHCLRACHKTRSW